LQLQLIGLSGVAQRFDGGVEVAVFFAQPLQLTRQNGAFFLAQVFLRHAPLRPNRPRPARAPPGGEYARANASSQGLRPGAACGAQPLQYD
jgi:hypothetical protein